MVTSEIRGSVRKQNMYDWRPEGFLRKGMHGLHRLFGAYSSHEPSTFVEMDTLKLHPQKDMAVAYRHGRLLLQLRSPYVAWTEKSAIAPSLGDAYGRHAD